MFLDISVIIPCFNRVDLLKETIKSVECAIEGLNAEIILVDDGSDTPISEQLSEFSHLPLVNVRQKNAGLTTSRYNGLLAAKGTYIQFLDSDDQIAPDKLRVQLTAMQNKNADVSYTDTATYTYFANRDLIPGYVDSVTAATNPANLYLEVQPAPHSPVFRKDYLLEHLREPFIPLTRDYDSIGEVWFYYNLSVFSAFIIKVDSPLTYIIHHDDQRLTDHWELMGLGALLLMNRFADYVPSTALSDQARTLVAVNAFRSYRRLPYDLDQSFQDAYISLWKKLGKAKLREINAGKCFSFFARIIGVVNAARLYKLVFRRSYRTMRTIPEHELSAKLFTTLQKIKTGNELR